MSKHNMISRKMIKIKKQRAFASIYAMGMLFIALLLGSKLHAQERDKGNLNAGQVNVIQEYRPTLADAIKINTNPVIQDSAPAMPKLVYGNINKTLQTDFKVEPIVAAKMKGEPLQKLMPAYVKLGFGNYSTSLLEAYYSSGRSKTVNYGFEGKHFSSAGKVKDYGYQGFADNFLSGHASFFIPEHVLKVKAGYFNQSVHYYGFERDSIQGELYNNKSINRQIFNTITASASLLQNTTNKETLIHDFDLSYYNFSDKFKNKENSFSARVNIAKKVNKERYGAQLSLDYFSNKISPDSSEAAILSINPYMTSNGDKWQVRLGINVAIETEEGKTHFLPDITAKYNLVDDILSIYGELKGYSYRNSYRSLSTINPFINANINFRTSTVKLDGAVGLHGNLGQKMFFDLNGRFKIIDSMALFTNKPFLYDSIQGQFGVIYDNVKQLALKGKLGYRINKKLDIDANITYYKYIMDLQAKPWQLPSIEFGLNANYNLGDKIIVSLDVFYTGVRYAKMQQFAGTVNAIDTFTQTEKKLKGYVDANLGIEYRYTNKIGAFLKLNNIAAQKYFIWNNYVAQRFNAMLGLNFKF